MKTTINTSTAVAEYVETPGIKRYNKNGRRLGTQFNLGTKGMTAGNMKIELMQANPEMSSREASKKVRSICSGETDFRVLGVQAHMAKAIREGFVPDIVRCGNNGKPTITFLDCGSSHESAVERGIGHITDEATIDSLIKRLQTQKAAAVVAAATIDVATA
jgi:hypothetical protein